MSHEIEVRTPVHPSPVLEEMVEVEEPGPGPRIYEYNPLWELSPLHQYWNPNRGDNLLTATAEGRRDAIQAGYTFVRTEGWVSRYQTTRYHRPLVLYWNQQWADNMTTSFALSWDHYSRVRTEGWVSEYWGGAPPIRVYWNSARNDTFTTATSEGVASAEQAGYIYQWQEETTFWRPSVWQGNYVLKTFWHAERQDHLTAATEATALEAARVGYQCLDPFSTSISVNTTQPPNTVPLDLYWSDRRGDNFTTATDQGRQDAVAAGYRFIRTEGFVWPRQELVPTENGLYGVMPLYLYWHSGREDNCLAIGPMAGIAHQAGYRFIRTEGFTRYVVPT